MRNASVNSGADAPPTPFTPAFAPAGSADTTAAPHPTSPPRVRSGRFAAYLTLVKPRVVALLLVTTAASMAVAAGGLPSPGLLAWTLLGGALGAAGANAINCWIDRDIDAVMIRTAHRAIPGGVLSPSEGLAFGLALGTASFVVLAVFVNVLAAALTLGALVFYVVVYTGWLKRSSEQNIVIGGAAGAVPPLVGWAAVTGEISLLAIYLFAIVFYWTPPHFWALALLIQDDYRRARVPMLPVVKGERETRQQILLYTIALVAITIVVYATGLLGIIYLLGAAGLGALFIWCAIRLLRTATHQAARGLFKYSVLYLSLLFSVMVLDRVVQL